MNIRQFAEMCGISTASVSRILNKSLKESKAAPGTYHRVRKMAEEYGFQPNYAAKLLHTNRSNCIGVILANPVPICTIALLRAITECTYLDNVSLSIATCRNDAELEAEAFENMLYRGVDAIIWHPTFQASHYSTAHVETILKKSRRKIPIFCLTGQTTPGVHHFITNAEEDGESAALRQLQNGCKKFAGIRSLYTVQGIHRSLDAYRDTLFAHGVPEKNFTEIILNDPVDPPQWEVLADVDGIWIYSLFALNTMLKEISSVRDLKCLHVDGQGFNDDYAFTYWTNLYLANIRFEDRFASMQCHLIDLEGYTRQATQMLVRAMKEPNFQLANLTVQWTRPEQGFVPGECLQYW